MRRKLHPRALGRQFAFDVIIVAGRRRRLCRHLDRIQNRGLDGYLRYIMGKKREKRKEKKKRLPLEEQLKYQGNTKTK